MFGDLFGEEDGGSSMGTSQTSGNRCSRNSGLKQPPLLRGSTGVAGIANQGATCYLNSLVQTMLFTPELRDRLFELGQKELGSIADQDKEGSKVRVIPIHLQRLFASLLLLNQKCASTSELTDSFGWTNNEELQQHDVQELNRILFCAIEDSLVGTSGQHLISQLYRGCIVNQITCEECNRISERPEDFLDLTLAVGGFVGVQDTLRSYYVDEERMEGSNQYRCDRCGKLVNARKGAKIRSLPPILTLSLLRFSYDYVKLERYKETGHYTFPVELDMAPYCEHSQNEKESLYELYSVVLHSGSTHGGHYHAYIRDIDNLGTWSEPVNELIQLTPDPLNGKDDIIDMKSPQQCLTALLRKHGGPEHVLTVEKLCQLLNQETGVSWNKRFKRQFGTMTKFVRKYNDLFEMNSAGTLVHMVDPMKGASAGPTDSSLSTEGGATPDASPSKGSGDVDEKDLRLERDQSNKERAIAKATSSVPEPGHCWYDFNDSAVQPIRESALNRQFQGRESAYMLLYRRKSSLRPKEAYSNRLHKMPSWLVAEMETANQELQREREEYDKEANAVEVNVLLSSKYQWTRGALHPKSGAEPIKITLDRRKNVLHLMELIKEKVPETDVQNECLHTAKEMPAGIHLFQAITDGVEKSLQDHYVMNGSCLLLWDGKQVGGASVLTGEHCEPILLVITHKAKSTKTHKSHNSKHRQGQRDPEADNKISEISHGFSKDTRVSALRCMVAEIVHIPKSRLTLSRVQSVPVAIAQEDDARTLSQLSFSDGDKLVAEDMGGDGVNGESLAVQESERLKGNIKLSVENRCAEPNDEGDWQVMQIYTPKDKTVSELKQMITNKFGLYGNARPKEGCRLRISDNALGLLPPLHENQSLTDAGIKQDKCIVIETGPPPSSNELMVNFTLPSGSKSWDIIIDKNKTASECLTAMLGVAELEDAPYHLRKTNWCGEPAGLVSDVTQTLNQLNIQDGELLILEEGRLPPKGFVLLPTWLYPPPYRGTGGEEHGEEVTSWTSHVQFSNIVNSIASAFTSQDDTTTTTTQPEPSKPTTSTPSELLGEIEISQDATVGDLKSLVVTLPGMSDAVVPTTGFLRLRLLEEGRMGRVLRDNNQSLKYAKVNSSSQIAVQILPEEEHIKQNEYVLAIRRRVPDTMTYNPTEELVWDCGKTAAPCSLRQAIADHLLLPLERINLAKHLPKKHEWLVIPGLVKMSDGGNVRGGRGGGRGGGGGGRGGRGGKKKGKSQPPKPINLKQAPYNIRDGDVIGVVDLEHDPLQQDDFKTMEDEEGKRRLQEEEEQKRMKRHDRRNAVSLGGEGKGTEKKKKQEVGLKIQVGNFR